MQHAAVLSALFCCICSVLCVSESFSVQLVLQYSTVDRMNCLWIVVVVSLLCPKSSHVMALKALRFGVHLSLMSAMWSLKVKPLS